MSAGVQALLRVGRNVADLDRAGAFYCEALGFRVVDRAMPPWTQLPGACGEVPRTTRLRLGEQEIELTAFANSAPYPPTSHSNDAWFQHCAIVVSDMDAAYERLLAYRAAPITRDGPQQLPPSTGSVRAFKFRDPDGHPLELLAFPPGSGDPRWQHARDRDLMLGLDHSAIGVADSERSITFYTQLLGMRVTARQVNHGVEQQRLDDLDGVRVDVVALQPCRRRTPHVELLGYLQPRGRAASARDVQAIVADRLILEVDELGPVLARLGKAGAALIAADAESALLRDPDGHVLVLVK